MTVRYRADRRSWLVDVKVGAKENPTGKDLRVRHSVNTQRDGDRLEGIIRADLQRFGSWEPSDGTKPKGETREGTLMDALRVCWEYPQRGWKFAKAGKDQHACALAVIEYLGPDKLCCEIRTTDYERAATYFSERRGNCSDTVLRKLQALHRVLFFAQMRGWITSRPVWMRPAAGQPREFVFSEEQDARVLAYFLEVERRQDMADLYILGVDLGCRLGELLSLTGEQVRDGLLHVTSEKAKSGKARAVVVWSDRAAEVLARRKGERPATEHLFKGVTSGRVARAMIKLRSWLDLEHQEELVFHATRHTAATRYALRGVPVPDMMEQLGHATYATTKRYIASREAAGGDA